MTAASGKTFLRAVGVLVGGAVLAQGITAISLWFATRLYTPGDFDVLAQFVAIVSVIGVAACLRFDLAIAIPKDDEEAINLFALALLCALGVTALTALALLCVPQSLVERFRQQSLQPFLPLVPVAVLIMGAYSALQLLAVRRGAFTSISKVRVGQSTAAALAQTGLGLAHYAPVGLLFGQVVSNLGGCVGLGARLFGADRGLLRMVRFARMRELFHAYSRFPKYSTLDALCNAGGMQVPIVMIAAVATGPEAGYLALASSVMQAPMSLIGNAVSQVFISRAPEEYHAGRLASFTATVLGGLTKSGLGPLLFAGITAPHIFALVFGPEWERAGVLVSWMTPWFVFQLIAVPVSMALHVTLSQRLALALQVFGVVLRCGMVALAAAVARDLVSEAYALSGAVFYFVYLLAVAHVVRMSWRQFAHEMKGAVLPTVLWLAAALAVRAAFQVFLPGPHGLAMVS